MYIEKWKGGSYIIRNCFHLTRVTHNYCRWRRGILLGMEQVWPGGCSFTYLLHIEM